MKRFSDRILVGLKYRRFLVVYLDAALSGNNQVGVAPSFRSESQLLVVRDGFSCVFHRLFDAGKWRSNAISWLLDCLCSYPWNIGGCWKYTHQKFD